MVIADILKINKQYTVCFHKDVLKGTYTSLDSLYIPYNTLFIQDFYSESTNYYALHGRHRKYEPCNLIHNNLFTYHKPKQNTSNRTRSVTNATECFFSVSRTCNLIFKIGGEDYNINLSNYLAYDNEDNILMALAYKRNFLIGKNLNDADIRNAITSDDVVLFISSEFHKNEIYKNIFKKIDKEIIQECLFNGIDVVFSSGEKIEKYLYSEYKEEIPFKTVDEMDQHLKTLDIDFLIHYDPYEHIEEVETEEET